MSKNSSIRFWSEDLVWRAMRMIPKMGTGFKLDHADIYNLARVPMKNCYARSRASKSAVFIEFVVRDGDGDFPRFRLDEARQRKHGTIGYAAQNPEENQEPE